MATRLDGNNAAARLRTIVESARDHGSGTMFVGTREVSHRSALGRLFKRDPVNHVDSFRNFRQILKEAYPNASDKISALLSESINKGRLTTGAIQRIYQQLHTDHKFSISYPEHAKTDQQRLAFEDQRALAVLEDPETTKTVCDCALRLADHIEKSAQFTDESAAKFLTEHINRQPLYPVHPEARAIAPNKQGLLEFLRTTARGTDNDRQALLLSMMWMLPKRVAEAENHGAATVVNSLYSTKVHAGKQHTDLRQTTLAQVSQLNQLGTELANRLEGASDFTDELAVKLSDQLKPGLGQPPSGAAQASLMFDRAAMIAMLRLPSSTADLRQCAAKAAVVIFFSKADSTELPKLTGLQKTALDYQDKQGEFDKVMGAVTRPGTFGNTEIPSTLMDRFAPHQKEREAVRVMSHPNERVQKFLDAGKPYISGSSGMANCGSTIFGLLKIDMTSQEGKRYGEALAAFIVGAGEHSYPEAYKSLNLSLRHMQLGQALP